MRYLLFLIVSLGASVIGAICGVGGGVVIKPTLDLLRLADVATIRFLSGCTVLSMSGYSVLRSVSPKSGTGGRNAGSGAGSDGVIDTKTATPLAIGAAIGGIWGQHLFDSVRALFENPNTVGSVQAAALFVITLGTLLYTVNKSRIRTVRVRHPALCALIGLALGVVSSFLGIGGGPINLVVLGFFFSMGTKTAAQNSLYVILFSQAANLLATLIAGAIPPFEPAALLWMAGGGIGGGVIGRILRQKMDARKTDRLFIALMAVILAITAWNAWRYGAAAAA